MDSIVSRQSPVPCDWRLLQVQVELVEERLTQVWNLVELVKEDNHEDVGESDR